MGWTLLYMVLFLKLPVAALLWLVWWAVHQTDEEPATASQQDGGSAMRDGVFRHPRPPRPRRPRRGPHGSPAPPAPSRMRSVLVLARKVEH